MLMKGANKDGQKEIFVPINYYFIDSFLWI